MFVCEQLEVSLFLSLLSCVCGLRRFFTRTRAGSIELTDFCCERAEKPLSKKKITDRVLSVIRNKNPVVFGRNLLFSYYFHWKAFYLFKETKQDKATRLLRERHEAPCGDLSAHLK